ncbi:porin family protein [uncultured Microbulbifer sp.]|uniref:porin family protein n=1 Tax=uncultured Microbulbifer sp. TaxID=348147 RepID=UPI00262C9042|nr:porin family protein [uncultured Microbulbifer sp.]
MKKSISISAITSLLLGSAISAQAASNDDRGLYVGASYGYMKARDAEEFNDENDISRLLVGAQLNKFVGIEGGYIDFGKYGGDFASAKTDGYTLGVNLTLPVTETFGLYARAGQMWWDSNYNVLGAGDDANGNELFYGAGAKMALTQNVDLRLEYSRYKVQFETDEIGAAAEIDELDTDLDYANVTLQYMF